MTSLYLFNYCATSWAFSPLHTLVGDKDFHLKEGLRQYEREKIPSHTHAGCTIHFKNKQTSSCYSQNSDKQCSLHKLSACTISVINCSPHWLYRTASTVNGQDIDFRVTRVEGFQSRETTMYIILNLPKGRLHPMQSCKVEANARYTPMQ